MGLQVQVGWVHLGVWLVLLGVTQVGVGGWPGGVAIGSFGFVWGGRYGRCVLDVPVGEQLDQVVAAVDHLVWLVVAVVWGLVRLQVLGVAAGLVRR